MRDALLPLSRPTIDEAAIEEVARVLRSGWLTSGPRVQQFEEEFARAVGAASAWAVSSGTAALHLALLAHGIGPGDEVVTPSMTWPAAVNMVERVGARPVFADVDRRTLQVTSASIEKVLTPRTRALLPVHFAGASCDTDPMAGMAAARGLEMIEDCAHAVGTGYRGRRVGSSGRTCCFSFHPIKNLTTGEGGMVTTGDPGIAAKLRLLRFHGVDRDAWERHGREAAPRYQTILPGFKYNLTDIQAALGIHQLARLDEFIECRARLAALYRDRLASLDIVQPLSVAPGTTRHAWHLFVVAADLERITCDRDQLRERLARRNIGTGLHFTPVHLHRYYRERYGCREGALPETEWAGERIFSLPLFPAMGNRDVADVCEALEEIAREVRR